MFVTEIIKVCAKVIQDINNEIGMGELVGILIQCDRKMSERLYEELQDQLYPEGK